MKPAWVVVVVCAALLAGLAWRGPHPYGRRPVPQVGPPGARRVEGCLRCHADTRGLGAAHDPSAVGCSACHLGDPTALEADQVHAGMEVLSGDLATAPRTCGRAGCHPDESARVARSLMAGSPGLLAVDRFAFGERARAEVLPQDDLRRLDPTRAARSPAEDHARKLCGSCHLGARKTARGDQGFAARGGGCAACHLSPPAPSGGHGTARLHPDVSAAVTEARCEGCHARSGRIALSYRGLVELEPGDPRVDGRLPDGRPIGHAPAEVHTRQGMTCIDCHPEREVMGDGQAHGFASEAVGIACEDCHAPAPARDLQPGTGEVAGRLSAAWVRRGQPALPEGRRHLTTSAGVPLWRSDRTGPALWLAVTGRRLAIPPSRPAPYHTLRGHQRLTCAACHAQWAPRCPTCHTRFDARGEDFDHLSGRARPGRWNEEAGGNAFGLPVLALDARGRIAPFIEGMHLRVDGIARPVERRLWAPLDPHTTGPARSCASCHPDGDRSPTYPDTGETTRAGAALLDAEARRRVGQVGRCVRCHGRYEDPVYTDFEASLRRLPGRSARPGDPHAP